MKIWYKGNFSTSIVLGWMFLLAVAFVVLVFSGSSEAQVIKKSFPFKEGGPIQTTQYAPAKMECGVLQIVRIKYTHVKRWKRYRATTSKEASFRSSSDSSVVSYEIKDPPYSAFGDQRFNIASGIDPIFAIAFGLNLPTRFELKPSQSREMRYGFRPFC